MNRNGSCLCGKVSLTAQLKKEAFDVCHCSMCRKWGGGAAFTMDGGKSLSFKGEEFITRYDSSEWAERGFCKNCGTHLFYRLKAADHYILYMEIFENIENFKFETEIFVDEKPKYYEFANKTTKMTGAEVFAKFAPESN